MLLGAGTANAQVLGTGELLLGGGGGTLTDTTPDINSYGLDDWAFWTGTNSLTDDGTNVIDNRLSGGSNIISDLTVDFPSPASGVR